MTRRKKYFINGHYYSIWGVYRKKKRALAAARSARAEHFLARILKRKGRYLVVAGPYRPGRRR
jgi:hypothetical protein